MASPFGRLVPSFIHCAAGMNQDASAFCCRHSAANRGLKQVLQQGKQQKHSDDQCDPKRPPWSTRPVQTLPHSFYSDLARNAIAASAQSCSAWPSPPPRFSHSSCASLAISARLNGSTPSRLRNFVNSSAFRECSSACRDFSSPVAWSPISCAYAALRCICAARSCKSAACS